MTIKSLHALDIERHNRDQAEIAELRGVIAHKDRVIAKQAEKLDQMTRVMAMQTDLIQEAQKERDCG